MTESISDSNRLPDGQNADGQNELVTGAGATSGKSKTKKEKSKGLKIAGALSIVLWTIGFILPFVLKKDSPYVWVSDTFLLTGFWPLLAYYKAGWTWLVFGILNMVLGFGLELVKHLVACIPDSFWTPEKLAYKPLFMNMHHHISDMHPCMPWLIIGFISAIFGIIRMLTAVVKWVLKKASGQNP